MQIKEVIAFLEQYAPRIYQESYDNCGLITGNAENNCTGVLCTLDTTEATIQEAIKYNCNLIVSHHPIVFSGLRKLCGDNYVERTVITAIQNNIAIYAIHTNLDNVYDGVSKKMAEQLGLIHTQILAPKKAMLRQFSTYVPKNYADKAMQALFDCGAGNIGNYSDCGFSFEGKGSFKPNDYARPHIGHVNQRNYVEEVKIECLLPKHVHEQKILKALLAVGYYEEIAYNIIPLENVHQQVGSGIIGTLETPMPANCFLQLLKETFHLQAIRHTPLIKQKVQKVAVCGGSGAFLIKNAIAQGADIYVTADIKYHEFFDAENHLIIADIGHYESEQFTIELLFDILQSNFSTFAVLKTKTNTNPVQYFH